MTKKVNIYIDIKSAIVVHDISLRKWESLVVMICSVDQVVDCVLKRVARLRKGKELTGEGEVFIHWLLVERTNRLICLTQRLV